jgi:hypothetical protein
MVSLLGCKLFKMNLIEFRIFMIFRNWNVKAMKNLNTHKINKFYVQIALCFFRKTVVENKIDAFFSRWFKHRDSVAASRRGGAQILMPNYVQYFSEMSEHLDSTPSYSRGEIRQWLHDYLGVGSDSASGSGNGRAESSVVQLIYHEVFEVTLY